MWDWLSRHDFCESIPGNRNQGWLPWTPHSPTCRHISPMSRLYPQILAVMAGAKPRDTAFHLHRLKQTFGTGGARYTTVRGILQGVAAGDVEAVFRLHAQILNDAKACAGRLRRQDVARQLRQVHRHPAGPFWSAPSPPTALVRAISRSTTSPTRSRPSSALLGELGLAASVVTVDALHCQKKPSNARRSKGLIEGQPADPSRRYNGYATSTSRSFAMRPPTPRGRATRHATSRCSTRAPISTTPNGHPSSPPCIRVQRRRLVRDTATGLWNLASETCLPRVERRVLRPRRRRRHPGTLGD